MTTIPDEPQDADPAQLQQAAEAIDDAKAAAGRVAKDDNINTDDLPSGRETIPAAPPTDEDEGPAEESRPRREDPGLEEPESTDGASEPTDERSAGSEESG